MEQPLGPWVAPLLLIPGMALLVISTATRFSQLLLHQFNYPEDKDLEGQLRSLRFALASLYLGIAAHAVAGLLGGLLASSADVTRWLTLVLSCLGVACLVAASAALARDALRPQAAGSSP